MIVVAIFIVLLNAAYFFLLWKYAQQLPDPMVREQPVVIEPIPVTIVVPFRNEAQRLPALISSLHELRYPVELLTVIFVDDHSTDDSRAYLDQLQLSIKVRIVTADGEGKKLALRTGILLAETNWIWTIDADVEVNCDALLNLIHGVQANPAACMICGRVRVAKGGGMLAAVQRMETESLQLSAMAALKLGHPLLNSGANLLFRKDAWMEVGGYSSHAALSSGDDTFLMLDIHRRFPGTVRGAEWSLVETLPLTNPAAFFAQRIRWAGKVSNYRDTYIGRIGVVTAVSAAATVGAWVLLLVAPSEYSLSLVLTVLLLRFLPERELLRLSGLSFSLLSVAGMSIFYPLILLSVGVMAPWVKVDWKGRRVQQG